MTPTDNLDTVKEESMASSFDLQPDYTPDETQRPLEDEEPVGVRLERFRRAHDNVTLPVEELEAFANDLIRQGEERGRSKNRREPEVWTANDQVNAVKYARDMGYVTDLEAQRLIRKLLRLPGKRTKAAARPRRQRARR
jgi:hypothetical protein